jgi:hypothetical protein
LALPWVSWIVHSATARLAINYVVKPLVPTLLFATLAPSQADPWQETIGLTSMFLALNLIINSRTGRNMEEMFYDAVAEGLQRFGVRPIVGLFWFIVDLFRHLMHLVERLMYAVDEWLRFKSRQSWLMMVLKGALGIVWFFVAYVIRFCVNLLIEPQLNPLKHIPWVSVSHKVMFPIWLDIHLTEHLAQWMSQPMADVTAFVIVFGTPGIFGFLIWELTENWRLFAANRPKNLRPVRIGAHGETMLRLLRPGFHSGTIPKRFAKLRRAERKATAAGGDHRAVRKHLEVLHHVETALRRYIQREFIAWFSECRGWQLPPPKAGEIDLATNEIVVEVALPGAVEGPLVMAFELIDGRTHLFLSAKVCGQSLSDSARKVLRTAIINVLKTGGVEVLDRGSKDATPEDDAWQHLEIGSWTMPWPEWVAIWENGGDVRDDAEGIAPWDQLSVI